MNWKESFRATLVEVDPIRLLVRIRETEAAIRKRCESLAMLSNDELQAISDATSALRILKNRVQAQQVSKQCRG